MSQISENLKEIQEKIAVAAKKSGRKPSDITLVGVTKTIDTLRMEELLSLGVVNLGENKVQEMMDKQEVLGSSPKWHMIGHLQTNKVKYIIGKVSLIHSVDSIKLGEEISKRSQKLNVISDILMEINIADEDSKSGIPYSDATSLAIELSKMKNIRLKGLMTVAPYVELPEYNRIYFQKMFKKFVDIHENIVHNNDVEILSMGMSNDFEVAIEEGATMVRIGTGIFGGR